MGEQSADIGHYPEVRRWISAARYADRPADLSDVLDSLRGFCEFTGRTPTELVEACLRPTAQGMAISGKGRRDMQAAIDDYVRQRGLSGREANVIGNHVRGFLVHNGVFLQGRASIS
jgi:hypothetical protein